MTPRSSDRKVRVIPMLALLPAAALTLVPLGSCAAPGPSPVSPVLFDTVTVWIHQNGDSTPLFVEIASSEFQHEVGLAGRSFLGAESGMVFQFESPRSTEDGFWMWRTEVPLDVEFIDSAGVIDKFWAWMCAPVRWARTRALATSRTPSTCPRWRPTEVGSPERGSVWAHG